MANVELSRSHARRLHCTKKKALCSEWQILGGERKHFGVSVLERERTERKKLERGHSVYTCIMAT